MKKQLYFTVQKQLLTIEEREEPKYLKNITVYEIMSNKPKMLAEIEAHSDDDTIEEIQFWLDNNGYGDDEFEFTEL